MTDFSQFIPEINQSSQRWQFMKDICIMSKTRSNIATDPPRTEVQCIYQIWNTVYFLIMIQTTNRRR